MEIMEKCSVCVGLGYTVKIKRYNLETGVTIKRKSIKVCTECNGIGIIPVTAPKQDVQKVKSH
ncbi:MAG: hypothetical protein ACXVHW_03500 [Methanobacterium sp.]